MACNAGCSFGGGASSDAEGAITAYNWSFGDGTTATGKTTTHTYPNVTQRYTVTLTVTDSKNQTASSSHQVRCSKVVNSPICFFTP